MKRVRGSFPVTGVLLSALVLLGSTAALAQTGTNDEDEAIRVPGDGVLVSQVRVLPFADRFDALKIAWIEPQQAGDGNVPAEEGPLTGYRIYYSKSPFGPNVIVNTMHEDVGVGVSGTIDGLDDAARYYVRVAPINAKGIGSTDAVVATANGRVTSAPDPDRVTALEVDGVDGKLEVMWDEPYAGHASLKIESYDIQYRTSKTADKKEGDWTDFPHGGVATEATITTAVNGTMYDVQVRATNDHENDGPWSRMVSGTPKVGPEAAPVPALPIFGAVALGAGLLAAGRARLRRRELRAGRVQGQIAC